MTSIGRRRPSGNAWIVSIANLLDELTVESSTNPGLTRRGDDGSMAASERRGGLTHARHERAPAPRRDGAPSVGGLRDDGRVGDLEAESGPLRVDRPLSIFDEEPP